MTCTYAYTLSLHDALPISRPVGVLLARPRGPAQPRASSGLGPVRVPTDAGIGAVDPLQMARLVRSEEHTSELQSRGHLVCRLLLEKKKTKIKTIYQIVC